jgi:hypothetical protein
MGRSTSGQSPEEGMAAEGRNLIPDALGADWAARRRGATGLEAFPEVISVNARFKYQGNPWIAFAHPSDTGPPPHPPRRPQWQRAPQSISTSAFRDSTLSTRSTSLKSAQHFRLCVHDPRPSSPHTLIGDPGWPAGHVSAERRASRALPAAHAPRGHVPEPVVGCADVHGLVRQRARNRLAPRSHRGTFLRGFVTA